MNINSEYRYFFLGCKFLENKIKNTSTSYVFTILEDGTTIDDSTTNTYFNIYDVLTYLIKDIDDLQNNDIIFSLFFSNGYKKIDDKFYTKEEIYNNETYFSANKNVEQYTFYISVAEVITIDDNFHLLVCIQYNKFYISQLIIGIKFDDNVVTETQKQEYIQQKESTYLSANILSSLKNILKISYKYFSSYIKSYKIYDLIVDENLDDIKKIVFNNDINKIIGYIKIEKKFERDNIFSFVELYKSSNIKGTKLFTDMTKDLEYNDIVMFKYIMSKQNTVYLQISYK